MLNVEGFALDPPPDYRTEEMTVGLRPQAGSSSLIVQSKKARAGASLDDLANETVVELTHSLGGMKNLSRTEMTFADGGSGVVLSYEWVTQAGTMRQYFVLRQVNDRVCTVTITVPRDQVTAESAAPLMKTIASIRPV